MKHQLKPHGLQMSLPLLELAPAELPPDKQRELALALAELLLGAASEGAVRQPTGGEDELEANA